MRKDGAKVTKNRLGDDSRSIRRDDCGRGVIRNCEAAEWEEGTKNSSISELAPDGDLRAEHKDDKRKEPHERVREFIEQASTKSCLSGKSGQQASESQTS